MPRVLAVAVRYGPVTSWLHAKSSTEADGATIEHIEDLAVGILGCGVPIGWNGFSPGRTIRTSRDDGQYSERAAVTDSARPRPMPADG